MPKSAPMEVDSEGEQTPRPPQPEGGDTAMAGGEPIAEIFAFPVLKTARAHQDANGLRHNDHYRYRQYCTRRLQRLYKNAKRGHGKGRFKNDNPISSIKSAGDLEILLVQAERNWSFFQQLKGDNAVKQQFCSATAQHGLRKLRKATATANVLHKFSLRTCDLRTQRETEAYELYMQSLLLCEQEKFGEAARMLEKCKGAYERLAAASREPELYKSMVEEVEPLLKRATHSAGVLNMQVASKGSSSSTSATSTDPMLKIGGSLGGDLEDEQVVATYAYRAAGSSTSGRSSKVECTNAKTKELLAKATTEKSSAREKVKTTTTESVEKCYEKCRELMQEALGGIHEDMLVKGDRVAGLENYCREQLIGIQLERDLLILQRLGKKTESASAEDVGGKNLKPEEGVRLAEGIKAELARVVELPGELDHDLEMAYPLLNNLRGFFVALCYMVCGKHSEAAAILELVRGRLEMQDEPLPAFAEPLTRPVELLIALGIELPKRALAWHARALALSKVPIPTAAPSPSEKVARDEIQAPSNGNQAVFPNNLRMKVMEMSPYLLDLAELELEQPNFDEFLPKNESKKDRLKGALGAGLNKLGGALGGLWGRKS